MVGKTPHKKNNENHFNEQLTKMRKALEAGEASSVRLSLNAFVEHDHKATYKNEIKSLLNDFRDKFGPEATFLLVTKSMMPAARNQAYTTVAAEQLVSLSYFDELTIPDQLAAAYTATEHLPVESAAHQTAIARLLKISQDDELAKPVAYAIARQSMLNTAPSPDLQKKSIKLWEHFLKATVNLSKINEARFVAKNAKGNGAAEKKALEIWEAEIDNTYKNKKVYSQALKNLTEAITDSKMPDIFTQSALERWESWRKDLDSQAPAKIPFLKETITLAEKMFNTDPEKTRGKALAKKLTNFKEDLCRDLLAHYPYNKDQKLGERALLEAARYEGQDKALRKDIIKGLEKLLAQDVTHATRAEQRADYYLKAHKEFLGIVEEEPENKKDNDKKTGNAPDNNKSDDSNNDSNKDDDKGDNGKNNNDDDKDNPSSKPPPNFKPPKGPSI